VGRRDDLKVFLVGQEKAVRAELQKYQYDSSRIEVVNAPEIIQMAEPPVQAIRTKKDSSIVVAMKMVKDGEADAFVGAGSTGAVLVGGQLIVGRIKGVERPPLAPLLPTEKGASLLIDCGANVDARPSHLVQFARMGSIYMEHVMGVKNGSVCKNGFDLYGTCNGDFQPEGCNCEHRRRGGEGQCTGQRNIPSAEGM